MAEALRRSETRINHWHRQLERTIAARTQELEASQVLLAQREKMAALGLMAAGVTHEVGNPLAAISAIVQRMERDTSAELREKCKLVLGEIERVSRVIDEMKQFARPLSRSSELVNVNEVLEISMKTCRYDPRAKDVRMVVDLDPEVPAIRGDGDRWQQVFLNLFNNAFDAMRNGGQLTIASRANNGQVELTIRDTGMGMTAEQLRNLFHPFYSTKAPGQGIGLGLSVCAGIVRSYGGRIEVKSAVGRGTQFRIIVPVPRPKKRARKPMSGLSPASQDRRESPT
jgi:signal transduction histidine kinase